MKKNQKGFNLSFFLTLGLIFLMMYFNKMNTTEETYTNGALVNDLIAGNVSSVSIQPNEQTPTGAARIVLKGGEVKILYATDVNELQDTLAFYGIDPMIKDVPQKSWFEEYGMTLILVLGVGFFIIYMMNMQAGGGGGGNSKMMNFGKSRAKMTHGDEKINLGSVAGLKEEKEDLEEIVEFLNQSTWLWRYNRGGGNGSSSCGSCCGEHYSPRNRNTRKVQESRRNGRASFDRSDAYGNPRGYGSHRRCGKRGSYRDTDTRRYR